jgi:hypothetical protein
MMNVVSFNLLENGVDSIIEGMNYFISDSKTSRKYKFALLLVAHGVELILKERLARINDILIYANIDKLDRLDRNDTESLPTVSLLDAIERLKHAKVAIDPKWVMVCRRMQKKRNEIQHLRVSLDIDEAKNIVGETIDFLIPFMRDELGKDLEQLVSDSPGIKDAIADVRHHFNLHFREAYNKMRAEEKRLNEKQIEYRIDWCPNCQRELVLISGEIPNSIAKCYYCDNVHQVYICDQCKRHCINPQIDQYVDGSDDDAAAIEIVECQDCFVDRMGLRLRS